MRIGNYNKCLVLILSFLFVQVTIVAQNVSKQQLLLLESEELLYNNPNEALKIGFLILKSSNSIQEKARVHYIISKIYKVKGDYNNSYQHLFEADKISEKIQLEIKIKIKILKAETLRILYLDNQSLKNIDFAEKNLQLVNDKKKKESLKAELILENIAMQMERYNFENAKKLIISNDNWILNSQKNNAAILKPYLLYKAKLEINSRNYKNANEILITLNSIFSSEKKNDLYNKSKYLVELSNLYFYQKNYHQAIRVLLEALEDAKKIENLYIIESVYKALVLNYLATKRGNSYKNFKTDFIKVKTELENSEVESVNSIYNLINQEYDIEFEKRNNEINKRLFLVFGVIIIMTIICMFFWFKKYTNNKRLSEIIKYLEITRNLKLIKLSENKEKNSNRNSIPVETEQMILNKLKKFENSTKFTNKEMSLAVLAGQFETNTKYLSEIINKHFHVNFNTYINKLRINFIVEKLKSDPNFINYKISYLAEVSGFASHSSFASTFKSITGIVPITFIELLKSEKKNNFDEKK